MLYSERECTFNSHSLTHLPQQVREHGPLILHSTFVFESMLAHLNRMFHGTRGIPDQICHLNIQGNTSDNMLARMLK